MPSYLESASRSLGRSSCSSSFMVVGWDARIPMSVCEDTCSEMLDEKRGTPGEKRLVDFLHV